MDTRTTFDTAEDAGLSGFPPQHCRVVASVIDSDDGFVLVDTNPAGGGYLHGVTVFRSADGWEPGSSGNGCGWTHTGDDLGTFAHWGDAPAGADRVRITWNGATREGPVADGIYLAVWLCIPDDVWPRVTGLRVRGEWMDIERV